MRARIYKPARNAMQSGTAKTRDWVLEYAPASAREVDPLMGWTSSGDMQSQVRLRFSTKDAALEYAEANGIEAEVLSGLSEAETVILYPSAAITEGLSVAQRAVN